MCNGIGWTSTTIDPPKAIGGPFILLADDFAKAGFNVFGCVKLNSID